MKTTVLGFLAESAIHCGAGRSAGIIDLPIAREAATDYPFVAGSGLKGALRDRARSLARTDIDDLFGKQDQAGKLLVSDARLLLLPVRCLTGSYRWVTSPLLLERYRRDLARCGIASKWKVPEIGPAKVLASGSGTLYMEERELVIIGAPPEEVIQAIAPLVRHPETSARLKSQLAIVGNDALAWFCRYAVPLQARNVLDDTTKRSVNLWYEESLPPDTLLYTLVTARDEGARKAVSAIFPDVDPYLQIGGNETVGHGWVSVAIHGSAS